MYMISYALYNVLLLLCISEVASQKILQTGLTSQLIMYKINSEIDDTIVFYYYMQLLMLLTCEVRQHS
jgi:hypothetical protein